MSAAEEKKPAEVPEVTPNTSAAPELTTGGEEKPAIPEPSPSKAAEAEKDRVEEEAPPPAYAEPAQAEAGSSVAKAEPLAVAEKSASGPTWPELKEDHPLSKLLAQLPEILKEADYNEVYGITLDVSGPFHTKLILQKFLRANSNDIAKAREQLLGTLKWRKEFQPGKARDETFSKSRFEGLGYVMEMEGVPEGNPKEVVTFNIYGAVKDNKATFGDLEGFLRWRVALMELGITKLNLSSATKPIPDFGEGPDPYQGIQIHDYLSVSFLRMDPDAKAASKKTIATLQNYYPETLSRKFFVNVPVIMGWLFAAMKLFVAKETQRKFTVLSYGNQLASDLGKGVPKPYGGEGRELSEIGEELKLA